MPAYAHNCPMVKGENIHQHADDLPENLLDFAWFREVRNVSLRISLYVLTTSASVSDPEHSGGEKIYSKESLLLHNPAGNLPSLAHASIELVQLRVLKGIMPSLFIIYHRTFADFSGTEGDRETVYPNGSLLLYNDIQKDTGFYTPQTLNAEFETQETHVNLHMYS
ncbi:hypothetical protein A6R68_24248, partial [Neotoma lepida]